MEAYEALSVDDRRMPLSSEFGTIEPVKAKLWSWLETSLDERMLKLSPSQRGSRGGARASERR